MERPANEGEEGMDERHDVNAPSKPANRELVSKALAALSRRELSRVEFIRKLSAAGFDPLEVAAAADWCESQGFLSDSRYAESTARRLSARYGTGRVVHTLRGKGVGEEAIASLIPDLKGGELARAQALWIRKFAGPPQDATDRARQIRFLQLRGFGFDIIKRVIAGVEAPE